MKSLPPYVGVRHSLNHSIGAKACSWAFCKLPPFASVEAFRFALGEYRLPRVILTTLELALHWGAGVVHFQAGCGPEGKPWRVVDPMRKSRDGLAFTKAWSTLSCDCVCSNGIEWSTCPLLRCLYQDPHQSVGGWSHLTEILRGGDPQGHAMNLILRPSEVGSPGPCTIAPLMSH